LHDAAGRLDPREWRHLDVHQDHIRVELGSQGDGFFSIGRLPDELQRVADRQPDPAGVCVGVACGVGQRFLGYAVGRDLYGGGQRRQLLRRIDAAIAVRLAPEVAGLSPVAIFRAGIGYLLLYGPQRRRGVRVA
jgi:hypothetical protein